jgi:hypothetical protein
MKKIKKVLFAMILPVVAIGGCATGYEKEGIFTNGYSDFQTSSNTFVVTFRANEHTPSEKVFKYAIRRAEELARKHGFRYFTILDQTGSGKHLPYPSLRLTIQCYHTPPDGVEWIDAQLH